jgi:hypothetical protein
VDAVEQVLALGCRLGELRKDPVRRLLDARLLGALFEQVATVEVSGPPNLVLALGAVLQLLACAAARLVLGGGARGGRRSAFCARDDVTVPFPGRLLDAKLLEVALAKRSNGGHGIGLVRGRRDTVGGYGWSERLAWREIIGPCSEVHRCSCTTRSASAGSQVRVNGSSFSGSAWISLLWQHMITEASSASGIPRSVRS